jgi:hypothetical protein
MPNIDYREAQSVSSMKARFRLLETFACIYLLAAIVLLSSAVASSSDQTWRAILGGVAAAATVKLTTAAASLKTLHTVAEKSILARAER